LDTHGVYWLSRVEARSVVFDQQGTRWSLVQLVQAQPGARVDLPIAVGVAARLPARLLAVRVPQDVADERRRKLRAEAQRKHKAPSAVSLADWTVFMTNAPSVLLTVEEALVLGRALADRTAVHTVEEPRADRRIAQQEALARAGCGVCETAGDGRAALAVAPEQLALPGPELAQSGTDGATPGTAPGSHLPRSSPPRNGNHHPSAMLDHRMSH
jgi:hypothetical protein